MAPPPHKKSCPDPIAESVSTSAAAALAVLTSRALLPHVTQFQSGIPILLHELASAYDSMPGPVVNGVVQPMGEIDTSTHRAGRYWGSAMRCGDLAAVQLVCRMAKSPEVRYTRGMRIRSIVGFAAVCGRLDVLQWLHSHNKLKPSRRHRDILLKAVEHQHEAVARWLIATCPDVCHENVGLALEAAARLGSLAMVCELIAFSPAALTAQVMDAAVCEGQWDVIQYFHEHSSVGCTPDAMDSAAGKGNLEVVEFLHLHRTEGCTTKAMDDAAAHGHLDVVRFLHENRSEGCTTRAMDEAAATGHFDVLRYLHDNRSEGCTINAMDKAAKRGHLRVVQFLHEHRTEGCTTWAMDGAARNGHLEIVQFLHGKRNEGCTFRGLCC